jgi:hypothetical protein
MISKKIHPESNLGDFLWSLKTTHLQYHSIWVHLAQIILFLEMLKFSKHIFLKRKKLLMKMKTCAQATHALWYSSFDSNINVMPPVNEYAFFEKLI